MCPRSIHCFANLEWADTAVGTLRFSIKCKNTMFEVRAYREFDEDDVVTLWRECELVKPWNDPAKNIRRKLDIQRDLFLVGILDGKLVATVIAGYEGHLGWINYLAVSKE